MKTLRIIDQTLSNCEMHENHCLEGNDYAVVYKKDKHVEGAVDFFENSMRSHFSGESYDDTIVLFVYGKNKIHPVRKHQAAYIVNDEGKTVERIFGLYIKN